MINMENSIKCGGCRGGHRTEKKIGRNRRCQRDRNDFGNFWSYTFIWKFCFSVDFFISYAAVLFPQRIYCSAGEIFQYQRIQYTKDKSIWKGIWRYSSTQYDYYAAGSVMEKPAYYKKHCYLSVYRTSTAFSERFCLVPACPMLGQHIVHNSQARLCLAEYKAQRYFYYAFGGRRNVGTKDMGILDFLFLQ